MVENYKKLKEKLEEKNIIDYKIIQNLFENDIEIYNKENIKKIIFDIKKLSIKEIFYEYRFLEKNKEYLLVYYDIENDKNEYIGEYIVIYNIIEENSATYLKFITGYETSEVVFELSKSRDGKESILKEYLMSGILEQDLINKTLKYFEKTFKEYMIEQKEEFEEYFYKYNKKKLNCLCREYTYKIYKNNEEYISVKLDIIYNSKNVGYYETIFSIDGNMEDDFFVLR